MSDFCRSQGIQAYQIEHMNQMTQGMPNSQIGHLKQERDHKKLEKEIYFSPTLWSAHILCTQVCNCANYEQKMSRMSINRVKGSRQPERENDKWEAKKAENRLRNGGKTENG